MSRYYRSKSSRSIESIKIVVDRSFSPSRSISGSNARTLLNAELCDDAMLLLLLQNIAMIERDDSSTSNDESDEDSDVETSDGHDSDVNSVHREQPKDSESEQTTRSCELPRIKMPKTSSKCRSRPCVEVLQSSDSDIKDTRNDQLH